ACHAHRPLPSRTILRWQRPQPHTASATVPPMGRCCGTGTGMERAPMIKTYNAAIASHSGAARAVKRWRPSYRTMMDLLFVAPALVLFTGLIMVPAFSGFFYSVTDWTGLGTSIHFVGFNNYLALAHDPTIWTDIRTTVVFALLVTLGQNGLALILALALN